jgi:hypothetical protein
LVRAEEPSVNDLNSDRRTFSEDVEFLRKHTQLHVLRHAESPARVAVSAVLQGRVMVSTASGDRGTSFGWINKPFIASGKNDPRFNAYGGEDRFWIGPEGGQFGLYFKSGQGFDLDNWMVPPALNQEPFEIVASQSDRIGFRKLLRLTNYSGTTFKAEVRRDVRLLTPEQITNTLSLNLADSIRAVCFESDNRIQNIGDKAWVKESGLLSIWVIGMFSASPQATVVLPIVDGEESQLGPTVRHYFGEIPPDRLAVVNGHAYFRGDGMHRAKIGISRCRAKPIMGSYSADTNRLTLVQYDLPKHAVDYVNSTLQIQKQPYDGDVVNSYNDGPATPNGNGFGSFYELETSSPAAELKPGESMRHIHRTFHFEGPVDALDVVAQKALGVSIETIQQAL